jgi:hypothetical protein
MPRKQPAAAPAAAPAATRSPAPNAGKKRQRVNRADFKWAVWVGNGRSPKLFAKNKDEVTEFLKGVKPSALNNVTVGELKQVACKVSADF